jgi:predicted transcriptional regulator
VETTPVKRRKFVGSGGEDSPSLGILEGEILRLIWDAGEPQSSVQVYEAMHFLRRSEKREMQSPSTIAVTLSRMVEKGLLTVERQPKAGKGYYAPTSTRAEVVGRVLDDVSRRLTGQSLGYLLSQLRTEARGTGKSGAEVPDDQLEEVLKELKRLQAKDSKFLPRFKIPDF